MASLVPEQNTLNINRSFLYGEGVFESLRLTEGKIPLLSLHCDRLFDSIKALGLVSHSNIITKQAIKNLLAKELSNIGNPKEASIRLTVYGEAEGAYAGQTSSSNCHVKITPLEDRIDDLNEEGLELSFYKEYQKDSRFFANHKLCNALFYVQAAKWAQANQLDEAFVFNQEGNIIESSSSNIFLFKENKLITPPLSEGCINGIMRKLILTVSLWMPYLVEERNLVEADILSADEIFLSNAVRGIQWVGKVNKVTYEKKECSNLGESLSNYINSLRAVS